MKQPEVLAKFAELVNYETGYPTSSITMSKTLEALDIDSLSILTILVNAEDAFSVKLVGTPAEQLSTIGELVEFITESLKE
jgi:acyl carrier protein